MAGPQTGADIGLQPATCWAMPLQYISKLILLNTRCGEDGVWTQGRNHRHGACSTDFPTDQNQTRHQTPAQTKNCYGVTVQSPDCISPIGDCVMHKTISAWRISSCEEAGGVRHWGPACHGFPSVYQPLPLPCQQGHHTTPPPDRLRHGPLMHQLLSQLEPALTSPGQFLTPQAEA